MTASETENLSGHTEVTGLTSLSQVLAGLGLRERSHLVELGVDAGLFEVTEVDAFAVNNTVGELLGQTLL